MSANLPNLPFEVRQILSGPHENFHYIIGDPATKQAAIVDPGFNVAKIIDAAARDGWQVTQVWLTHCHWDHVGGLAEAVAAGATDVFVGKQGASDPHVVAAQAAGASIHLLDGDTKFGLGEMEVHALHTPGHQPEGTCFLVGAEPAQVLLGGDTLFVDTCGRTDFPGGDTDAMFASMARLRTLAQETIVLPGHHYSKHAWRAMGDQLTENPALATQDRKAFGELHCLTN